MKNKQIKTNRSSVITMVSVVVPVYNERENIDRLHRELQRALNGIPSEIIFIDDGSEDGSSTEIMKHKNIDLIQIKHAGKTEALKTGFIAAKGEIIITIDADLQEDVSQIPYMIELLSSGYDFVQATRLHRKDSMILKKIPSFFYNIAIFLICGSYFKDINCGFRAFTVEAAKKISWTTGAHRLLPMMVALDGGTVRCYPVAHYKRRAGKAKFNSPARFMDAIIDLIRYRMEVK